MKSFHPMRKDSHEEDFLGDLDSPKVMCLDHFLMENNEYLHHFSIEIFRRNCIQAKTTSALINIYVFPVKFCPLSFSISLAQGTVGPGATTVIFMSLPIEVIANCALGKWTYDKFSSFFTLMR